MAATVVSRTADTAAASAPAPAGVRSLPLLFGVAIFWSAALLFWVEPLVSKQLLPLLGGSPGVWNTCLVFFQAVLLLGYAFAHAIAGRLRPRLGATLYLAVLVLAAAALLVGLAGPAIRTEPDGWAPIPWLLLTLAATVGLPFFALAATGPTLQRWFSLTTHPAAHDPYFLYAASNLGSMLGLLAFPSLLEPLVPTSRQVVEWGAGFVVLVGLAAACAAALVRWPRRVGPALQPAGDDEPAGASSPGSSRPAAGDGTTSSELADVRASVGTARVTLRRRLRWLLLAFVPSSLLLGVTTYLSTDVAAVPLLWIIPLAVYLATFTLVFASRPPIPHRLVLWVAPFAAALWVVSVPLRWVVPFWSILLLQVVVLFVSAMACHGELAQDRPPASRLTEFYLWVSLGGVLGGAFNTLVAPLLFTNTVEYPLAILLMLLVLPSRPRGTSRWLSLALDAAVPAAAWGLAALLFHHWTGRSDWWLGLAAGLPALLAVAFPRRTLRVALALAAIYVTALAADQSSDRLLYAHRDFFGRIRVLAVGNGGAHELMHGTTLHGKQSTIARFRRVPVTYYGRTGPVGQVFAAVQNRASAAHTAARVAAVGLGTGTLAAYARPGEQWTFYELNPAMVRVATNNRFFSYVNDAPVRPRIVLGDARLSLRQAPAGAYDLIVLDAFSSDAIPVHLVTREAVRLYVAKLAPGGLLAFNISNRFLDLEPVLAGVAREDGLVAWYRDHEHLTRAESNGGIERSEWVVLARHKEDLGPLAADPRWAALPPTHLRAWSDDFSGLLPIIEW